MSGGFTDAADTGSINLAKILKDEQHITVYRIGEVSANSPGSPGSGYDSEGRINLNTASKAELMTLPGIGDKIAGSIIEYRETNGDFKTIEDIMSIQRIGEKTFNELKDKITVE